MIKVKIFNYTSVRCFKEAKSNNKKINEYHLGILYFWTRFNHFIRSGLFLMKSSHDEFLFFLTDVVLAIRH